MVDGKQRGCEVVNHKGWCTGSMVKLGQGSIIVTSVPLGIMCVLSGGDGGGCSSPYVTVSLCVVSLSNK